MINLQKRLLALPVEIYTREFFTQLYLALKACEDGFQVILGEQNEISFKTARNGIFLHKDHANWSERIFKNVKSRNMLTAALDSEGLIYPSEDDYLSNRASKWILANIDLVFLWGSVQKNLVSKVSKGNNNFHIVGSPKFDMCNLFRENHKNLTHNYKRKAKKILINTRFASTNIKSKDDEVKNLIKLGVIKSAEDFANYESFIESENIIYAEFLLLIKELDRVNGMEITIRPHPVECLSFYDELAREFNSVRIDNFTGLHEQILDHDCLIHDGCTTAIEANCMGKVVFGLRPSSLKNTYSNYANQYSHNFNCYRALKEYLINTNICDYKTHCFENLAKKSIHNWNSSSVNATHLMLSKFNELNVTPQEIVKRKLNYAIDLRKVVYHLYKKSELFKAIFKCLKFLPFNRIIKSQIGIEKKFPDLNLLEIQEKIKLINLLDLNTAKLEDIYLRKISKRSILIFSKDK